MAHCYEWALEQLELDALKAVAIEDNVGGVEAAAAAGVPCIAFPNENTAGGDFSAAAETVDALDQRHVISLRRDRTVGAMSELKARVTASDRSFRVEGYERIDYDLVYVDGVFELGNADLADCYRDYGRALMVVDETVYRLYRRADRRLLRHHGIALTVVPVQIRETAKSLATFERIVGEFDAFGLRRTEPVLVVGGGLTTDVAGFACASYRRNTPYIRIPTTLIGLIDASVSIKVAVNHGKHKNRLGAYHASQTGVPRLLLPRNACPRIRSATAWPS